MHLPPMEGRASDRSTTLQDGGGQAGEVPWERAPLGRKRSTWAKSIRFGLTQGESSDLFNTEYTIS